MPPSATCAHPAADVHMARPASITLMFLLVHVILICWGWVGSFEGVEAVGAKVFDVVSYGAVGDGKTDDQQAFAKAWAAGCSTRGPVDVVVPQGRTFLLGQSTFRGPCSSSLITFKVFGTIFAPSAKTWNALDMTRWITFKSVENFGIEGTGIIDGRGSDWWPNSCKIDPRKPCTVAPAALTIDKCKKAKLVGITIRNSPKIHLALYGTTVANIWFLNLLSPADSPNTDGIHLQNSRHIFISDVTSGTGDDCISIGSGCGNIRIANINCGPGHGISVGSLGINKSVGTVQMIHVWNATFSGTTNGVRIKTWQGGFGYVKKVTFEHLQFNDVSNPIIIDQYYCDSSAPSPPQKSAMQISEVSYLHAVGTSKTDVAITLNCSSNVPCTGLLFQDVHLTSSTGGQEVRSTCINAKGTVRGTVVPPVPCLA